MKLFISGFIILIILNIQNSFAQPGTPDSSFSKDGKVFMHVGNKAAGNSVALQADGKICSSRFVRRKFCVSTV